MLAEDITDSLLAALDRPDLQTLSDQVVFNLSPRLTRPFIVSDRSITLGAIAFGHPDIAPVLLRYALELDFLCRGLPVDDQAVAIVVAARVAALFHRLDCVTPHLPSELTWLSDFAASQPPPPERLAALWPALTQFLPDVAPEILRDGCDSHGLVARLAPLWSCLAPAEYLMADGGDERLVINPETGLNRYGCSHRPRPWAVTFSSSTASSLSERGYLGAERARRAFVLDALIGGDGAASREAACLQVRQKIAALYGLGSRDNIILAASGTDCELAVLAMGLMRAQGRAIVNILIAPDETGSGVPLAAQGRHFAAGTALGSSADKARHLEGFPAETTIRGIAIRLADGTPRTCADLNKEVEAGVREELEAGHHVILHQLDMSKTGLVGPCTDMLCRLAASYPERITLVVDACQARLAPHRITSLVRAGMLVMTTGSKFLTGPPFCGAILLPDSFTAALPHFSLPQGLAAYFHRCDWPHTASPTPLGCDGNLGLALRWQAALAESEAFAAVPAEQIVDTLRRFERHAHEVIAAHPALTLLTMPSLDRRDVQGEVLWDTIPTVFSFLVHDPDHPEKPLDLERSRALHRWLNADLSPWVPGEDLAPLLCHLGQPVPVPHPALGGENAGALRLCAGARLVSGEPSHAGLPNAVRLEREFADVRRALAKITVILDHWTRLAPVDPQPRYAPYAHQPRKPRAS
ncbi:hypothetical protein [Asaia bogorensis]|uniref:hypothetical protein n=1 Tax=Asaia bogorensis TaxID=91915 RepID=UPI000EFCBC6F|nr:hypothetical protein [Asaia bogorensis]